MNGYRTGLNENLRLDGITVSVAMCTYNGARFLCKQLESIAAQTRLPDEVVICDDRSSDESSEIAKAFGRHAPFPVHFEINDQNVGATKNFERAIERCSGDVIALSDQDDIWHPTKLKRMADVFARSTETLAVFSDGQIIDEDSAVLPVRLWESFFFSPREQMLFAHGHGFKVLLKHPVVTGAAMAFRSRCRGLVLPISPTHAHDYWISVLLAACGRVEAVPEALIQYRRHGKQQIGPGPAASSIVRQAAIAKRTGREAYLAEINGLRDVSERLEARGSEFGCGPLAIERIAEKITHRYTRAMMPSSRLLRVPTVLREVVNGRYWHYSEGYKSIAKDLFFKRVDSR